MCGIFGWSLKPEADRSAIPTVAAVLAIANDERGGHSWGLVADGAIARGLGCLATATKRAARMLGRASVAMAHTRFATTGAHTIKNAHPFEIGGLVGAHNGIVYNHECLNRYYGRSCAVDSMHLFHHLAYGLKMGDIEAYGSIEWIEADEPEAVNLACFNGGELTIAKTEIGVLWSSDHDHLAAALGWAELEYEEYAITESRIYSAHAGELYKLAPIKIGARKATTWPTRWDDARKNAGAKTAARDRLPSSLEIQSAWDEWEAEQDEKERLRIEAEEQELDEEFRGAYSRDF